MAKTKVIVSPLQSMDDLLSDLDLEQIRQLMDYLFVMRLKVTRPAIKAWRQDFLE